MKKEITIFYSYAETDRVWQRELAQRLRPLYRRITVPIIEWHRGMIPVGSDVEDTLQEYIKRAQIIFLLITPDFMAEYDKSSEIKQILELKFDKSGKANDHPCVIPILMRDTYWKGSLFTHLAALPTNGISISAFKDEDRDPVYLKIAYEIEQIIDMLHPPLQDTIKETAHIYQKMPPENPFFTGREELLKQIHNKLMQQRTTALTHRQAIYGLGGVGKTQLAVKYVYDYRKNYQYVFWVNADIYETIIKEYIEIAQGLVLLERNEQNQISIVEAVKDWLETHAGWLLVMDNADDLNMVRKFIPATINGHLLLTTRSQPTGGIAEPIEIQPLSDNDGTLFLLRRAKKIPTGGSIKDADPVNQQNAREIVKQLGGLPLALDQAGAYLEEAGEGLQHYLELYQNQRSQLLQDRGKLSASHPMSVVKTFLLIFEKVQQLNLVAANVLQLCAFLAPDIIPESLLIEHHLPTITMSKSSAPGEMRLILNEACKTLLQFSLIRRDDQASTFAVHRLVQAVLRDDMESQTQRKWAVRTILIVDAAFPVLELHKIDMKVWRECQKLLPQALACSKLVEEYQIAFPRAARLLNDAAVYLTERAQYQEAERLLAQALRMRKAKEGRLYAQSLYNQGEVYRQTARYSEAEQNLKEALWLQEQELGTNHPDIALTLHSLAELYNFQKEYDKARPRYERAMKIYRQHFGPEHSYLFQDSNSLAALYVEQGQQEKAEELYKTTAEISERELGKDHRYTAKIFHDWGEFCKRQGKLDEAEALHKRALEIRERTLGEDNPDTATSLHNIAELYEMQGRLEEAEKFYKRSLAIRERVQGRDHPDVADSIDSLAKLYVGQKKVKDAEADYKRALSIRKKKLGAAHPLTLQSQQQLAEFYKSQQRLVEAERLYKQSLASLYSSKSRLDNLAVEQSLQALVELYELLNKHEKIEQLYEEVFDQSVNKLGINHPFTEKYLAKLIDLYKKQNDMRKLEDLYKRVFALRASKLSGTSEESLEKFELAVKDLINFYENQRKEKAKESIYKNAYEICNKRLGERDRLTRRYYYAWMEASEVSAPRRIQRPSSKGELELVIRPQEGRITIPDEVLPPLQFEEERAAIEEKKREWRQEEKTREEELLTSYREVGCDDPHTIQLRRDLAQLYESHNKPKRAERIYCDAVMVSKVTHGSEGPCLMECVNDLVSCYLRHKKPGEAQPFIDEWEYFCESFLQEEQLIPEEYTVAVIHYLANAASVSQMRYKTDRKKSELAAARFERALEMSKAKLGSDHQDTIDIRERYIILLKEMGYNDKARALEINPLAMGEAPKNGTGKNTEKPAEDNATEKDEEQEPPQEQDDVPEKDEEQGQPQEQDDVTEKDDKD